MSFQTIMLQREAGQNEHVPYRPVYIKCRKCMLISSDGNGSAVARRRPEGAGRQRGRAKLLGEMSVIFGDDFNNVHIYQNLSNGTL